VLPDGDDGHTPGVCAADSMVVKQHSPVSAAQRGWRQLVSHARCMRAADVAAAAAAGVNPHTRACWRTPPNTRPLHTNHLPQLARHSLKTFQQPGHSVWQQVLRPRATTDTHNTRVTPRLLRPSRRLPAADAAAAGGGRAAGAAETSRHHHHAAAATQLRRRASSYHHRCRHCG
jgi:hypothetical protein